MLLLSALDSKCHTVYETLPPQMKEKNSNQQVKPGVTHTLKW
jgi:hypothetical protein